MQFDSKLKGNITEIISATLFETHGYRVIPLGVEKVVREIVSLDQEQYSKLDLPATLRSMPDFLVSEIDMSFAWLIEVKYRKSFSSFKKDEALKLKLISQAEKWGEFWVLLFLGKQEGVNPHSGGYCGLIRISLKDGCLAFVKKKETSRNLDWKHLNFSDFSRLQTVFKKIPDAVAGSAIEKSIRIIKQLTNIDAI
jgi:hypothetical protein